MAELISGRQLRRLVTIGAVAAVALLYLCMVGLVEAFKDRNVVTGVITLGAVMLLVVPHIAGYRAALPPPAAAAQSLRAPQRVLLGLLVALSAGAVAAVLWQPGNDFVRRTVEAAPVQTRRRIRGWTIAALVVAVLILPQVSGTFLAQVAVLVGLYMLLALGLNIVVGYAGLLDLGYVAFFAVGAYLTALLTSPNSSLGIGLPFFVALPIVMLGAGMTGLLLGAPVLSLGGDYLAIVTLGV